MFTWLPTLVLKPAVLEEEREWLILIFHFRPFKKPIYEIYIK